MFFVFFFFRVVCKFRIVVSGHSCTMFKRLTVYQPHTLALYRWSKMRHATLNLSATDRLGFFFMAEFFDTMLLLVGSCDGFVFLLCPSPLFILQMKFWLRCARLDSGHEFMNHACLPWTGNYILVKPLPLQQNFWCRIS